ncbi:hypothetical protein MRB53_026307 [Persea americana]|uniref:Uncharacterized protein n=1 Tax=Persea americana TaxID=3435 RepID=A0ACC2LHS2_PERAE|nr:hypothetical protein MRB53_026307 [Persea americana]
MFSAISLHTTSHPSSTSHSSGRTCFLLPPAATCVSPQDSGYSPLSQRPLAASSPRQPATAPAPLFTLPASQSTA